MFSLLKMGNKQILLVLTFSLLLICTRYYNLDHTARFTRDESSDLARMSQYYKDRRITLVGPIDSENIKVFSSLTYYMVMPFAAITHFVPVGPVYGVAFYGILTVLLLLVITYKLQPKLLYIVGVLGLVWYPLLEMSRWAWNPHLLAFWNAVGVLSYLMRKQYPVVSPIITGLSLALMFHHHYVAILATAPFIVFIALSDFRKRQYASTFLLIGSYILPYLIFLAFDLKNPPGLFFGKFLFAESKPNMESKITLFVGLQHLVRNYGVLLESLVRVKLLQYIVGILIPILLYLDIKSKKITTYVWFLPVLSVLFFGIMLSNFEVRYVYSALIFFFVWVITKRKNILSSYLAIFLLLCLLFGSILTVWNQLTVTLVPPDIYSLTKMGQYVQQTIKDHSVKNSNIAVLGSPDSAPLGEKYRDLISMDGTSLRAASEYDVSENLFILSTSTFTEVQKDDAYAMKAFKNAQLKDSYLVPNSEWRVYWIGY